MCRIVFGVLGDWLTSHGHVTTICVLVAYNVIHLMTRVTRKIKSGDALSDHDEIQMLNFGREERTPCIACLHLCEGNAFKGFLVLAVRQGPQGQRKGGLSHFRCALNRRPQNGVYSPLLGMENPSQGCGGGQNRKEHWICLLPGVICKDN